MNELTQAIYRLLISEARGLLDTFWQAGSGRQVAQLTNPEFERGMVELIIRACGLRHDEHTEAVRTDLMYGLHKNEPLQDVLLGSV